MTDVDDKVQGPDATVASIGEARRRREQRAAGERRPEPEPQPDDEGYGFTLDLADSVNLPDEDVPSRADEILARYESSTSTAQSPEPGEHLVDQARALDDDQLFDLDGRVESVDEIRAAISEHHVYAQPAGAQAAARGSADLSPPVREGRRLGPRLPLPRRRARRVVAARVNSQARLLRPRTYAAVAIVVGLGICAVLVVGPLGGPRAPLRAASQAQTPSPLLPLIDRGALSWSPARPAATLGLPDRNSHPTKSDVDASGRRRNAGRAHDHPASHAGHKHTGARSSTTSHLTTPAEHGGDSSAVTSGMGTASTATNPRSSNSSSEVSTSPRTPKPSRGGAGESKPTSAGTSSKTAPTSTKAMQTPTSGACQRAGVMAPSDCGRPSL